METFGSRLRLLREARGWSQERLGFEMDVTGATVSKWENNRAEPGLGHLVRLRQTFAPDGVTLDWLIDPSVSVAALAGGMNRVLEPSADYVQPLHAVESEQEIKLLLRFRAISALRRRALIALIEADST